jgi:hemoglobin
MKIAHWLAPTALMLASLGASAETTYPGVTADGSDRFGGKAAMDVWAQDLHYYMIGDNRINQIFKFNGDADKQTALRDEIEELILSSPVDEGRAKAIAAKYQLKLTRTEYNAVIENAYLACDASRTPYTTCNCIIAAMAPLSRAVATR